MDQNIFLYALAGVFSTSLVCSRVLGPGKGAIAMGLLFAIGLGVSIASYGPEVLLIAAYAGGFVFVAAIGGLAIGAALPRK